MALPSALGHRIALSGPIIDIPVFFRCSHFPLNPIIFYWFIPFPSSLPLYPHPLIFRGVIQVVYEKAISLGLPGVNLLALLMGSVKRVHRLCMYAGLSMFYWVHLVTFVCHIA